MTCARPGCGCLPRWLRRGVLGPLAGAWPKADWLPRYLRAKTLLTNLVLDPPEAYANTLSLCRLPLRRRLLARDLAVELNGYDPEGIIRDRFDEARGDDPLAGMIAADTQVCCPTISW